MKGRLIDLVIGLNRKQRVTVEVNGDYREEFDRLKDTEISIEIKKHYPRRSVDANAYCWVLLHQLADVAGEPVDKVYQSYITNIGSNLEILPIKNLAVVRWKQIWSSRGLGWVCLELGKSKLDGYTNVACYYGSSTFDSHQTAKFIDLIITDCKEQGITTETPEQIARYKETW